MSVRIAHAVSLSLLLLLFVMLFVVWVFWPAPPVRYDYPGQHRFAVAICDDTDGATLTNIRPVYEFLTALGAISTKTVWVYPAQSNETNFSVGMSISDDAYRQYMLLLQARGFEIAFHGARGVSTTRLQLIKGLEYYRLVFGDYPAIHINHSENKDNLYWGAFRLRGELLKLLYGWVIPNTEFSGHIPKSPYFWGDVSVKHIEYSRDFSFHELNLAKIGRVMPYHDPEKPLVKKWFHTSDAHDVTTFNTLLQPEQLDQLEQAGGYSIIYTHFAKGFYTKAGLDQEFQERIRDLMGRDVWLTTTGELLNFLERHQPKQQKNSYELFRVQLRWVLEKLWYGRS